MLEGDETFDASEDEEAEDMEDDVDGDEDDDVGEFGIVVN